MPPELTELGASARDPLWNRVAEQLGQARLLLPAEKHLLLPSGRHVDTDFQAAHESMRGLPKNASALSMYKLSAYEHMLQHVYGATRNALRIALTMRGTAALDEQNECKTEPLPNDTDSLLKIVHRELELIHRYSELLGLSDPAGQLMEIHSIARETCALPGTDPVLVHANNMASGPNLDFDIDDVDTTRIPRFPDDTRVTAMRLERLLTENKRHNESSKTGPWLPK
ncbi:hypothetical protein COU78_04250 [Candidatus Peregrinibacteria bacterium CG10_big_fil_rev_8_21_14_0_10_49_24]|nr:MAG: hypothetical protein COV83_00785 [Candidatus Peregrinibacteria bacterium CG11_big_fil_rev_8_21_14_0_20_49_14]PIR50879.1 MAG: hypothetical protein COU78_04250 [Candidatus Peregrinibacteria bacterium CG10_big_fil_rev_8_21_14_0_10_49_24]PJA67156.1 MAG: hypothetical protein CO157_06180 [Candidatus Peregrinibacteria bacterium CG_4_9_14_3_um_filter_49_12]